MDYLPNFWYAVYYLARNLLYTETKMQMQMHGQCIASVQTVAQT